MREKSAGKKDFKKSGLRTEVREKKLATESSSTLQHDIAIIFGRDIEKYNAFMASKLSMLSNKGHNPRKVL